MTMRLHATTPYKLDQERLLGVKLLFSKGGDWTNEIFDLLCWYWFAGFLYYFKTSYLLCLIEIINNGAISIL